MRYFTSLVLAKSPESSPAGKRKAAPTLQKAQDATRSVLNVPSIFVGNLSPIVTPQILDAFLKSCGKSLPITIRCSRGSAVALDPKVDAPELLNESTYYTTVRFHKLASIKKALELNAQLLCGRRVIISLNASDLPEMQLIAQEHRDPSKIRKHRSLKREDTLILDFKSTPETSSDMQISTATSSLA